MPTLTKKEERLFEAIKDKNIELVQTLILEGVNVNSNSGTLLDATPLATAIRIKNVELVKILLEAGAEANPTSLANGQFPPCRLIEQLEKILEKKKALGKTDDSQAQVIQEIKEILTSYIDVSKAAEEVDSPPAISLNVAEAVELTDPVPASVSSNSNAGAASGSVKSTLATPHDAKKEYAGILEDEVEDGYDDDSASITAVYGENIEGISLIGEDS